MRFTWPNRPASWLAPCWCSALRRVVTGYLVNPQWIKNFLGIPGHWFSHFVESAVIFGHPETPPFDWTVAGISTVVALAGIGLAYLLYGRASSERTPAAEQGQ